MFKGWTAKRRWLIGCLMATAVLALVAAGLLIIFFRFMDALNKVPPESTQLTLYNDTNERLRINKFEFGNEVIIHGDQSWLDVKTPGQFTWFQYSFYREQPEMEREVVVSYTGMSSGETWHLRGIARRVPGRPCKFLLLLAQGGGTVSSCEYNELQDFEHD